MKLDSFSCVSLTYIWSNFLRLQGCVYDWHCSHQLCPAWSWSCSSVDENHFAQSSGSDIRERCWLQWTLCQILSKELDQRAHSHKKGAWSQHSPVQRWLWFQKYSLFHLWISDKHLEPKLTTFSGWTYRGEFVLFSILRLSIFILQWKELPKYLTRTSDF